MLHKFLGSCLFALSLLIFNNVHATDYPDFIDPDVYVTNEMGQAYNLVWEIAKVKTGQKPIVFGIGKASVAPHTANVQVGKFDWFEKAGSHGVDINKVTIKVFDQKNHLLYQKETVKEHIFVGTDAKLDRKLNLFVNISSDHNLSVRVSEK